MSTARDLDLFAPAHLDTDALYVQALQAGEASALEPLMAKYRDRIFQRAFQLLKSREDAEEVTQDAFIRAWQSIDKFRGDSAFSTWLYQIATNLAHNRYWHGHRRKRHATVALEQPLGDEGAGTVADVLPDESVNTTEMVELEELGSSINEALGRLRGEHREILELRFARNLSYESISQRLGLHLGTVKSRIARARQCLREAMCTEFALAC